MSQPIDRAARRVPPRRRAFLAARDALVAAAAAPALAAAAPLRVQAVHGFADQQSFTLWLQGSAAQRIEVAVWRDDAPAASRPLQRRRIALDALADCTASLRIADLDPGAAYRYRVLAPDATPLATGRFRTQPLWQWRGDPPTVRIVAGSCAYLNDGRFDRPGEPYGGGEQIFDRIAALEPDLMLWLGDNIYLREPEWTSREGISRRYRFYREHAALRRLWSAAPHVAIWDDHDFGPNDADASFSNRAWSLEMFRRYWPLPYAAPADGLYGLVTQGDVDLFLLDDRSWRWPNRWPEGPEKALYGAQQMQWLKAALLDSQAPFKLIAGGSQFWNRASRYECWTRYPAEQDELRRWLATQKIPGVLFLSGDRHFAQLLRIERPGLYPLHELTTSPLTSGPVRDPGEAERSNPDLVAGTMFNDRNFALLTVSGPRKDRRLEIELRDGAGAVQWRWGVRAADLDAGR